MANVIVVFESKYGQTEKIAEHVADLARRRGHDVLVTPASRAETADLSRYDAIVVAGPVYLGRHHPAIEAFVRSRADVLSQKPSAFLSVSGSAAAQNEEGRANALRIARLLVDQAGARVAVLATVGGAMAYPKYGFFLRWFMKRIARREGGPTDTSRTHEMTDWAALDRTMGRFFGDLRTVPADVQPHTSAHP